MGNKYKINIGFTLIEIMIAMAVASIVIMIAYSIINSTSSLFTSQTSKVDARDDVRMVLNQIAKDIEQSSSFTASSPSVFTLANGNKVSYFYDSTKKAVVEQVNGGTPSVMLQNVSNTFNVVEIPPAGSNTFSITLEAVSKSYAVGKTDLENYNMTVVRRQRDGIVSPGIMLQSAIFSNRTITVNFSDNSVAGLTLQDFTVTATLNGVPVSLSSLTYNAVTRTFGFTPFPPTSVDQQLILTITTNSTKVYGGPISSQPITIYSTGSGSPGGKPYGDINRDWFTNQQDINLDYVNGTISYNGLGNLVIPKGYNYVSTGNENKYDITVEASEGIVVQGNIDSHNMGHGIDINTDLGSGIYGIHVEGINLTGQDVQITTKGDIYINSTNFIIANGKKNMLTLSSGGTIHLNSATKINGIPVVSYYNGRWNVNFSDLEVLNGSLLIEP